MTNRVNHFIFGKEVISKGQASSPVYQPALGEVQKEVFFATEEEIQHTLEVAHLAFLNWSKCSAVKRARVLFEFKQRLLAEKDTLCQLIVEEHGKTREDAEGEFARGLEVVEFACGIPHLLKGAYSENVGTGVDCYSLQQPLGVCLGITPFNFPAMVPLWMFPIALACGNSFILKPSEKTPSAAMLMAKLLIDSGCPPGVMNVLHAPPVMIEKIVSDPHVQAVSFVGSTPVAETVYQLAAKHGKRVQALGGAKNHCVVLEDAPLQQTVDGIMGAAFGSAGERCMAISVVVAVGARTGDALVDAIRQKIEMLNVGPGFLPDSEMGPLISRQHLDKVQAFIQSGLTQGAQLLVDGRDCQVKGYETGFFLGPTLFDHVKPSMKIYQEEIFGPVLSIVRVDDLEQAIALTNAHPFGNGCAIYTQHGGAARKFASEVQVGMVGVNVPIPVPMAFYTFGGWKRSLLGDHNIHGQAGVQFYTHPKTVTTRWQSSHVKSTFAMPVLNDLG